MKAWICTTGLREAVVGGRLVARLGPLCEAAVRLAGECRATVRRPLTGTGIVCVYLLAGGLASQAAAQLRGAATGAAIPLSAPYESLAPSPGSCPEEMFTVAELEMGEDIARSLERLSALAEACDARGDFHALRGALMLSTGNYADALLALEKALLLSPDLAGAQLDYAEALARLGQRSVARELVQQVFKRPDIEPGLRAWLRQEAEQTSGIDPRAQFAWSGMLQSSIGRESNLVSASHTRELTLFLLGGPVQVQLADNQRPRAGMALRLSGAVQAALDPGFGALRVSAFVQQRRADASQVPDLEFAHFEVGYSHPLGEGQIQWLLARQRLRQAELYAVDDLTTSVGYAPDFAVGPCKGVAALGWSDQRYAHAENMAGRYQFGRVELRCAFAGEWRLGRTAGSDKAVVADRPGGEKRRSDVYLRYERPFELPLALRSGAALTGRVSVWARSGNTRDATVYSELLGSAPIHTRREDFGVGLWWRTGRQWEAGVDVEKNTQSSTNPLQNINSVSAYAGLRRQLR